MLFLDTNVLVYAVDPRDPRKQQIAQNIVEEALEGRSDCSQSVQTLTEFVNVALQKLKMPEDEVRAFLLSYLEIPTVSPDRMAVVRGFELKRKYGIQFYDAMMLAVAERAGAETIYTEDLNDGQQYGRVTARNPFALAR